MGPASAYSAVLETINMQVAQLIKSNSEFFTFNSIEEGINEMRDFGTTGVVAFARGQSFLDLAAGRHRISGRDVQVQEEYRTEAVNAICELTYRFL